MTKRFNGPLNSIHDGTRVDNPIWDGYESPSLDVLAGPVMIDKSKTNQRFVHMAQLRCSTSGVEEALFH